MTQSGKTVVIIEDDPWSSTVTAALLAGEGYAVIEAKNGEVGLDLVREHLPDVVLLDLALPRISGAEVLRMLKSNPLTAVVPVILVSSYADLASSALSTRADAVLQKPWDFRKLLDVVGQVTAPTRAPQLTYA